MSQARLIVLAILALLVVLTPFVFGVAQQAKKDKDEWALALARLERGMTPEQVRRFMGAPKQMARQILYHRYREQWIYDAPFLIRLTFDCPRGKKPQLLSTPEVARKEEPGF